jgi:GT2 family glycosyltransferase
MSTPTVDIVTVNYNSGGYLPEYYSALAALQYPHSSWRVVMVDNASTDDSLSHIDEWRKGVSTEIVHLERNGGVTAGNNAGIRAGASDYVALLNPDTRVHSNWLTILVERMEQHRDIGLAEAAQVPSEIEKYREPDTNNTSWASTGGVLVRRSAIAKVGLFDERFFMYEDDVDMCWRLWSGGWRCTYEPDARYDHRPHDERPPSPFLRYHAVRNQSYMRFIYGSNSLFMSRLWLGLKFAARDQRADLRKATLRAVRDAIAAVPWLRERRKALPQTNCVWVGLFTSPYRPVNQ